MKKLFIASIALLLGGCYTYQPPVYVDKEGKPVNVQVQQVYVVREYSYYYTPVTWHVGIGIGRGHYRGPWRH